jgi:N-acetylneuraminic acid mutarotase
MVYDAESDRVILFGGLDAADQPLDDVWAYDYNTDSWEQVASGPGGRWLQSMVYDSESDRVVVYGGIKERGCFDGAQKPKLFHDTWTYDFNGNTWMEVVSDQDSPPARGMAVGLLVGGRPPLAVGQLRTGGQAPRLDL